MDPLQNFVLGGIFIFKHYEEFVHEVQTRGTPMKNEDWITNEFYEWN